jgi:protocatechuate 3,4-dioxygenase, beta subunit
MSRSRSSRRGFVAATLGAIGLSALGRPALADGPTPRAMEGPFYPTPAMRRPDVDNDLVRIIGMVEEAGGEVFRLKGRITDRAGNALPDHRIEIWQCDTNGKYMHPGDRQAIAFDAAFQGFGHDITGPDGSYEFRTIKPVVYPGRTPHIHVKVLDGTREVLTTQFYIAGHPANAADRLYTRMSQTEAAAVSMVFTMTDTGEEAVVDVVI